MACLRVGHSPIFMPDMPEQQPEGAEHEAGEMYSIEVPDGLTLNPGDTLTVKSVSEGMAQVECEHAGEDDADEGDGFDKYKKDMLNYMSPKTDGETQEPPER